MLNTFHFAGTNCWRCPAPMMRVPSSISDRGSYAVGCSDISQGGQTLRSSILIVFSIVACTASSLFAQTEGRVSVGGSFTFNHTTDADVGSTTTVGPLIRLNPHKGWGPAGAFNWFRSDLSDPAGVTGDFAQLRVRPLMAGLSYTVGSNATLISFSIVGGPSFNQAEFHHSYVAGSTESIHAANSIAVRPGVGVTWTVARRVAVIGFGGYLFNRPDVVYRNRFGEQINDRWKADAVVLSMGAVYSLF
jgi:hypothetical protein